MEVGFKSDKGQRRQNNEDACFILLADKVYVVADGVGGGNAGEIASRTAVSQIANYIVEHPIKETGDKYKIASYFQNCLDKVNGHIFEMANKYTANRGMATTIVVVYAGRGKAYITNVGDSRAYLFRSGQLTQLTEDHTYVNTLVKAGVLTPEQAETDERKNVITKAMGAEPDVEPDFFQVDIAADDIIIMCTDGLYDEVSEGEIVEVLSEGRTMSETCSELVRRANDHGGHDNITVISLRVTEEDIHEQ
ncbi:MAG: Stp1/IreP family PP2C-type Ser/Thr phosphatase [Anaerovoracaceae bacterium]|nr:Stp1/IreP family PP2C-type Ser/Thr phosphatase [Anaerovoracaceae bacterium]